MAGCSVLRSVRYPWGMRVAAGMLGCLAVLAVSCAHGPPPAPVDRGRPDAAPSMAALPTLQPGCSAKTQRTHAGMLSARNVFDDSMPPPPSDHAFDSLQEWVEKAVAGWVEARRAAIEETRYEFHAAGTPSPGEEIVAHAVIGLIHEDTARSLEQIPTPRELDTEPEIAEMFGEVTRVHARPFLSAALVEFRDCVNLAYDGPEDMRHWANFCQVRFARLRAVIDQAQGQALVTEQ